MGDPRAFLKIDRVECAQRPVQERVRDYCETTVPPSAETLQAQASRCMDCGVPFCHSGCPLANLIPEWNDKVFRGRLDEALQALHATNNFPEMTGRVCPAPCEASCVLNLEGMPITIKTTEKMIAEHALSQGLTPWRTAEQDARSAGKRVAVVGSGPAGLAAAQQLARAGHAVTVYERDDRAGGLLRYGIPDFKLHKQLIDLRLQQMVAEGVRFETGVDVGVDVTADHLRSLFDAVVLAGGARVPRDLPVPGRELRGVHFAMTYLTQQNRRVAGDPVAESEAILATDKRVVVLGGGDTGADCVGTANRQGASSIVQVELLPEPGTERLPTNPWPEWPQVLRTSSSHEEGCERRWALMTTALRGEHGRVVGLDTVQVEMREGKPTAVPGTEQQVPADLVLLAMGFIGPEPGGIIEQLGVTRDDRGNVSTDASGATSVPGIFAAGDMARGQSLVVWAIADGRRVAAGVDAFVRRGSIGHRAA